MATKCRTPQSETDREFKEFSRRVEKAVIRILQYCGEQCVNQARNSKAKIRDWIDRYGNLRSSIGYGIAKDGKVIVQGGFDKTLDGEEGVRKGIAYVNEIAQKFPHGIVLIVEAGMHYASYVADKGYDVLDSAELLAEKIVPKMLKQIGIYVT